MVKVLLLEQWYNLSDPQMEEALGDRISFRRFVGLGLQDKTPDHSTISRFRTALGERGLSEQLFQELERQLTEQKLVLKQKTLMDATLVEAQGRRPPTSAGRGAKSTTDPEADWTYTHRGHWSHFGYKVHLGVDQGSGLVRRAVLQLKDPGQGV
jgi:IS5 family transposase